MNMRIFLELKNKAKEVGLAINIDKTKMLIQTRRDQVHNNIEMEEDTIEVVDNFIYLGVNLAKTGSEESEIQTRTTMANKAYLSLIHI